MRLKRSFLITALYVIGSASVYAQGPAPALPQPIETTSAATFGNGYSLLPYFQADALLMHRSQGGFDPGTSWGTGPRFVVGIPVGEQSAIETSYFSIFGMNGSASSGPLTDNTGGLTVIGSNFNADYHAFITNAELNFRHWFTPEFSLMAGFRYVNWHENLGVAFDAAVPIGGMVVPLGTIREDFHTNNNLYGFQIGAEWKGSLAERFGMEVGGKAGVFGNRSQLDASVNVPVIGSFDTNANATRTAFVGELGLVGTYAVTNYLKLRAGYQVMWIENVALAPQQLSTANIGGTSTVNSRGNVFLHGAVVGLEYRW